MTLRKTLAKALVMGGLTTPFMTPLPVFGVTGYDRKDRGFVRDLGELRASINLPSSEVIETVKIPYTKIKTRLKKNKSDERIDPIQIYLPKDNAGLAALVNKLAKPRQKQALQKAFIEKLRALPPSNNAKEFVTINEKDFSLIKISALANELAKPHRNVTVDSAKVFENTKLRRNFLGQIKPFLSQNDRLNILSKLRAGINLRVDDDLLPDFAEKMIKKFVVFRGPNCFHAALSFHGQKLTRSPNINVKEERGYHRAMINYDELWRAINRYFYEVDPNQSPLKYGDMLVFYDVPKSGSERVNFRWIRHTATYLFGPYTFSKGSKSPNTPYTIKTLEDEWDTWMGYTSNLGVKVFRRTASKVNKLPPVDLTDWVY